MMTMGRCMYEMAKPKRGGQSIEVSQLKWKDYYNDPEAVTDVKDGEKRVRIVLDDHVQFISKFGHKKKAHKFEQAKKSLTVEELAALQNRIMTGHDEMSLFGPTKSLSDAAKELARSAGSSASAFQGQIALLGDVTALAPRVVAPKKEEKSEDEQKKKRATEPNE